MTESLVSKSESSMHCPSCQHLISTSFWKFPSRFLTCENCNTPLQLIMGRGSRMTYYTLVFFFSFLFLLFLIPGIFIFVGTVKNGALPPSPIPSASGWILSAIIFLLLGRWLLGRFKTQRGRYAKKEDLPGELTSMVNSIPYALPGLIAGFFLALPVFSIWGVNKQITLAVAASCGGEKPHRYNDFCLKLASFSLLTGADINFGDPERHWHSPLNIALDSDNRPMVNLLMDQGADVNSNKDGHYPIFRSLHNPDLFHLLLEHGARTDVLDENGHSVLREAAFFDEYTVILHLIDEGNDPNRRDNKGVTPLMIGAKYWPSPLLQEVVKRGGDLTLKDRKGRSVVHQAAKNKHPRVLQWLAEKGIPLDQPDKTGRTPLFFAIGWESLKNVETLLAHGASVNASTASGLTPLALAVQNQKIHIVTLLLKHGARVNQASFYGWTPLHWAAYGTLFKGDQRSFSSEAMELLLVSGANVHARGTRPTLQDGPSWPEKLGSGEIEPLTKDWTPLHVAARFGFTEGVGLLLDAKADPNAMTRKGNTPLSLARENGHLELMAMLIARGAQPELALKP